MGGRDHHIHHHDHGSNQSIDHEDAFATLQLKLNNPQRVNEREIVMMEEDYYFCNGLSVGNSENYYGSGGRTSGKKWSAFVIACIDLGCSTLAFFLYGRALITLLVNGNRRFLLSSVSCSLILTFYWFIASWKLLESAYLRKRIMERYQMARFWRVANIALLIVFILSSLLWLMCLYGECDFGFDKETMGFLHSVGFHVIFVFAVFLACIQRVIVIWIINKYINELKSELSIDSLPLRVL